MKHIEFRRENLNREAKPDGVDGYLITNLKNVSYLTGFTGDSSYLLLSSKLQILITDSRFQEQVKEECEGLDAHVRPHNQTTVEAAVAVLNKSNLKNVGVEANHISLELLESLKSACPKVNFVPVSHKVEWLRAIKDETEVEAIKESIRHAERAYHMFVAMLTASDTEKKMSDDLEIYLRRAGAKGSAFSPIIAVGERGALPHAPTTNRVLEDGSKLLIDWGADNGYKSDLTRVVKSPFGPSPTRKNKFERSGYEFDELHRLVYLAQEAAVAKLRDGVSAKEVDAAARAVFKEMEMDEFFTHGLGHGIGLDVHEFPRIRQNSPDELKAGMVVTIEPGLYIPGWGGMRLEDNFLITKDGSKKLSMLSHDPNAIK